MQDKKHKCQICGAEYKACNSCDKLHDWRSVVDTQKCWLIYLAVTEHRLRITTDSEFVAALAKLGINKNTLEKQNIIEPVKAVIHDVLSRSQKERKVTQQPFEADKLVTESKVSAEAETEDK